MTWALQDAPGVPTHLVAVLMGLANHADERGKGSYPSQATIAEYARKGERAIRKDLKELVSLGLVVVSDDQSPAARIRTDSRPVVYDLRMDLRKEAGGTVGPPGTTVPPGTEDPPADTPEPGQEQATTGTTGPGGTTVPGGTTGSNEGACSSDEPTVNHKTSSSKKSSRTRGTRIPDDFTVTPEMVAWCRSECPDVNGQRETQKFFNYWQAKTGAGATKLDWNATWRNWMLNAADRASPQSSSPPKANGHQPYQRQTDPNAYSGGIQ